jgi:hypothetical protein
MRLLQSNIPGDNMTVRTDLESAFATWTSDGREAFEVSEQVFAAVAAAIRNRFPGTTLAETELLLADVRRDTEDFLFGLLRNALDHDAVIEIVASRFFGEDT